MSDQPFAWRVVDNTMERGRWVKLPDGRRQFRGPERAGTYVLPMPACRARVETVGERASLRFVAVCSCGWRTGPLLTAMQAEVARADHDGSRP